MPNGGSGVVARPVGGKSGTGAGGVRICAMGIAEGWRVRIVRAGMDVRTDAQPRAASIRPTMFARRHGEFGSDDRSAWKQQERSPRRLLNELERRNARNHHPF